MSSIRIMLVNVVVAFLLAAKLWEKFI